MKAEAKLSPKTINGLKTKGCLLYSRDKQLTPTNNGVKGMRKTKKVVPHLFDGIQKTKRNLHLFIFSKTKKNQWLREKVRD